MEQEAPLGDGYEVDQLTSKWVRFIDHKTEVGERIVVAADVYHPDDMAAYEASIEDEDGVRSINRG